MGWCYKNDKLYRLCYYKNKQINSSKNLNAAILSPTDINNNNDDNLSIQLSKNIQEIEIGLVMLIPWVSYLIASMCGLSGIVVIMFNGLSQAAYTKPNLTSSAKLVRIFF